MYACFVYFRNNLYETFMVESLSEKEFDILTEDQLQKFDLCQCQTTDLMDTYLK